PGSESRSTSRSGSSRSSTASTRTSGGASAAPASASTSAASSCGGWGARSTSSRRSASARRSGSSCLSPGRATAGASRPRPPADTFASTDVQLGTATIRVLRRGVFICGLAALVSCVVASPAFARAHSSVEVVVTLKAPSLASAATSNRELASFTMRGRRLQLESPSSVGYLEQLNREQTVVAKRIARAIHGAYAHWRYGITLNGMAVVVPRGKAAELAHVPGVARVWQSATYRVSLDHTPQLIGAPIVWGPQLTNTGQGIKIGI